MREGQATPWGRADQVAQLGNSGIYEVMTPSHGGIFVPDRLLERIPEAHQKRAEYWSGSRNWYEEDCEWASVAHAFPELFNADQRDAAYRTLAWRAEREQKEIERKQNSPSLT